MGFFSKKPASNSVQPPAPPAAAPVAATGSVLDHLKATVSRISRDHIPVADLDVRAHLLDSAYIDSLSATELLADIERTYKVRIEEMDLVGRLCSLDALAREIETRTGGTAK